MEPAYPRGSRTTRWPGARLTSWPAEPWLRNQEGGGPNGEKFIVENRVPAEIFSPPATEWQLPAHRRHWLGLCLRRFPFLSRYSGTRRLLAARKSEHAFAEVRELLIVDGLGFVCRVGVVVEAVDVGEQRAQLIDVGLIQ